MWLDELLPLMAVQEGGGGSSGGGSATSGGSHGRASDDAREDLARRMAESDDEDSGEDTVEEEFDPGFFWQDAVIERIMDDINELGKQLDIDVDYVAGWFQGQQLNLISYLEDTMNASGARGAGPYGGAGNMTETPEGMAALFAMARNWVGIRFPAFNEAVNGSGSGSGRGRSGGGGPKKPTAEEIRAQFDTKQMANIVNDMSRGLVLQEAKDADKLVNTYINAIIKNPEQQLDFETFVRTHVLSSNRAKAIYMDKPESMSHEQFLQPYVQAAQQMIGPGFGEQLANIATGGARLAASPDAYRSRLNRERQVQLSTPFLNRMGEQLREVAGVLR